MRTKSILVAFMFLQVLHVAYEHVWLERVGARVNDQSQNVNSIRFALELAQRETATACRVGGSNGTRSR